MDLRLLYLNPSNAQQGTPLGDVDANGSVFEVKILPYFKKFYSVVQKI